MTHSSLFPSHKGLPELLRERFASQPIQCIMDSPRVRGQRANLYISFSTATACTGSLNGIYNGAPFRSLAVANFSSLPYCPPEAQLIVTHV